MAGNDHIGLPDPSGRKVVSKVPELVEALATVVPMRGSRLHHLAQTISSNVERDLFENDLDHRDSEVRRLVLAQHVQLLRDALQGSGAFAGESAALLSLRWADRTAFEAYGQLHARLCPAGFDRLPDTRTIRDMLLALRLRMARLDWESIAELLESLGRPCEETALRKRQSRLASMAVVAGCERQWRTIDGYLKAKRRSYGGTPRKFPLLPLTVLFLVLMALTAAAWVFFRSSTPMPPETTEPPSPEESPLPSVVPKPRAEPPRPPRSSEFSPPPSPLTPEQSEALRLAPDRPVRIDPDGVKRQFGVKYGDINAAYILHPGTASASPFCEVVAYTSTSADENAVLRTLKNVSDYPKWMETITNIERVGTRVREGEQAAELFRADLRNRAREEVDTVWRVSLSRASSDAGGRVAWVSAPEMMPTRRGVIRLRGGEFVWVVGRLNATHVNVKVTMIFPVPAGVTEPSNCEGSSTLATAQALKDYVERQGVSLPR